MNIIVNSEFKPYTFAQMLEPYKIIKDERQKIEEDYSTLMSQAEAFKNYANQIENSEAKGVHQSYMDALRQASDEFSSSTTSMDRRALRELKRRYYDEILPIANAAEQVKQAASDRDKISIRHPSAIYKKNGYSIDKAMAGESANNEYVVGDDILNKTKEDVQALVAANIDYDARSRQLQDITKPYFVFEQGFDENTLSRGLDYSILENELSDTEKQIRSIKESARQAAGYDTFDEKGKAQLDAMIDRGIRQGGTKTFATMENENFESPSLSYSRYSSGRSSSSDDSWQSLGKDVEGNEYFLKGSTLFKKTPSGQYIKEGTGKQSEVEQSEWEKEMQEDIENITWSLGTSGNKVFQIGKIVNDFKSGKEEIKIDRNQQSSKYDKDMKFDELPDKEQIKILEAVFGEAKIKQRNQLSRTFDIIYHTNGTLSITKKKPTPSKPKKQESDTTKAPGANTGNTTLFQLNDSTKAEAKRKMGKKV